LLPNDATASIANETRLALILKPPQLSRRSFDVLLPPRALLGFGFGIPNASLAANPRPGRFQVTIGTGDGQRSVVVDRRVDPAVPEDRRWLNGAADLSTFAGKRVSIEFAVSPEPGDGPAPMGAYGNPVIYDPSRSVGRPNVLVISLDTLRARNLGAYGYARETSPFLDELASQGGLFENAITTSVTTGPSHMSLFTGLYPVNHGLSTGLEHKAERVETLAGRLHGSGYHTAAFTENGYVVRTRGFGDGFSEYTENRGIVNKGPGEVRLTFGQARRFLKRAREPFYLFVHTYQVHSPFRPPKRYSELFADDGHPGPDDPVLRRQRDNYDREIRYVDDRVRELVGELAERGVLERTLVVVLADHGEEFHEHGYYQHGGAVFEESIRIPMIYVGPGIPAGRHAAQVSLIDVMPTVLDYVGEPAPEDLDGVSLLGALQRNEEIAARTLFTEARAIKRWLRPYRGESWRPMLIGMRSQHGKFIAHRPATGAADPTVFYDLRTDAEEAAPRRVEGEELAAVDAMVERYLDSRLSAAERSATESPEEIDPELRERLRLLGYLVDD
jgi:arylsulfatase A-like enzyme